MRLAVERVVAVATDAADAGCAMSGTVEVGMRSEVAAEALLIDLFWCCLFESEYLGCVAARLHVGLTRAVATLAGDTFAAMHQGKPGMRIGVEFLCDLGVAQGAGFGAGEV